MTTDERIERLTERHEALTQSVELLVVESRKHEERLGQIMESIASLVHVAEIHEQRIERLEDQN